MSGSPLSSRALRAIIGLVGHYARAAALFGSRRNHRGPRPVLRNNFHDQNVKWQVRSIFSRMCKISRFVIVLPSFIDGGLASLNECQLAGDNVPNSRPYVVMRSYERSWGKRVLSGSQFKLPVKLGQVAEGDFLDFDDRGDAAYFHLTRKPSCLVSWSHASPVGGCGALALHLPSNVK